MPQQFLGIHKFVVTNQHRPNNNRYAKVSCHEG